MARRRILPVAACIALAALTSSLTQLPASAQAASKTQEVPGTIWDHPNTNRSMDGMGTWMYVAPQSASAPGQVSRSGYEYLMSFVFPNLRIGSAGLATGPNGPVARLAIVDLVTQGTPIPIGAEIAYNWSPGRFYFLYVQRLGDGSIGGWVMDWEAGTWAYIGSVAPPTDWGRMVTAGRTMVRWSGGLAPTDCGGYPVTDAYMFPILGYTGSNFEVGVFAHHDAQPGDCPAHAETLGNGWAHYRLGS